MNLTGLSETVGLSLQDSSLYEEAFTHKSFANENAGILHNERLEFLGDAVLELIVTEYLFAEFPEEPEGKMTKLRSALVSGVSLSKVAKELNLGQYLRLSKGEDRGGGRTKNPILANVMESLIGAIYLDLGQDAAKEFIHKILLPRLPEILEKKLHRDPKSAYQEWAQEKHDVTPEYKVLGEEGPDHKKVFTVGIFLGRKKMAEGKGSSKQKAEVNAAENAMEEI